MTMIHNLNDLARYLGEQADVETIKRRLYKETVCGVGVVIDESGFGVMGYCEGIDHHLPMHFLKWPFSEEDLEKAIDDADDDGGRLWDATHGCEDCRTYMVDGYKPIDPDCPSCGGSGTIL